MIPAASELREPEKYNGDCAETTALKSEKLALARSRTELRGPTHQLAVRLHILHAFECTARLTSTGSTRSVYLEGTRSHNEGRVSTPACYLQAHVGLS